MRLPTAALICLLSLLPRHVVADIYRYVDEGGTVCFTDNPRHAGYRLHLEENKRRSETKSSGGYYPYRSIVQEAGRMCGVEEPLLRAVIEVESDFNQYAISSAGARGLMQLMPATMLRVGVSNPWDPRQNVQGGARYLQHLISRFSGDLPLALAAYNAGINPVVAHGRVPPYPQTQMYVQKVLALYWRYAGFGR